jgi:hypothetical protein
MQPPDGDRVFTIVMGRKQSDTIKLFTNNAHKKGLMSNKIQDEGRVTPKYIHNKVINNRVTMFIGLQNKVGLESWARQHRQCRERQEKERERERERDAG